jgi:thiamine biosynthesis lipoprotein
MIQPSDIGAHRFGHQAMATEFEIFCVHPDSDYVQQAARAAFDLLDRLESELSRFLPNSDISRINNLSTKGHLAAGEIAHVSPWTRVSRWTMECLEIAGGIYVDTGGAFDISLGSGFDTLQLSPRDCRVSLGSRKPAAQIDLGGIGKGYAVDRMAEVLAEWEITRALLHGGHSSVRALDAPPGIEGWPLGIGDCIVHARHRAFSASGIRVQGRHIIDPRMGAPRTGLAANQRVAAWVSVESDLSRSPSAVAEGYSTAFMVLTASEVDAICSRYSGLEAHLLETLCEQNS